MAKSKKVVHSHQKHLSASISYIAILSVVAIVVFMISNTQENLQIKNSTEEAMSKRTELMARGINPDPIAIRQLPIEYRFTIQPFAYEARSAYLMSDIADFGNRRDDLKIGSENKFLAVEMDIAYIKELGTKLDVGINKHVRVSSVGRAYPAVSADTLKLGPDQNATVYVIFAVPMSASEFVITTGTKTTNLDFASANVNAMQGVFTTTSGFSPRYE